MDFRSTFFIGCLVNFGIRRPPLSPIFPSSTPTYLHLWNACHCWAGITFAILKVLQWIWLIGIKHRASNLIRLLKAMNVYSKISHTHRAWRDSVKQNISKLFSRFWSFVGCKLSFLSIITLKLIERLQTMLLVCESNLPYYLWKNLRSPLVVKAITISLFVATQCSCGTHPFQHTYGDLLVFTKHMRSFTA